MKTTCLLVTLFVAFRVYHVSSLTSSWTPDAMRDFCARLDRLETKVGPDALASFYEAPLVSFSVQPGSSPRMSITSTCFALQAILAGPPGLYGSLIALDPKIQTVETGDPRTPVHSILQALVSAEWRPEDLFQVPLLLYTLLLVEGDHLAAVDEQTAGRVGQLVEAVLQARPRRRNGSQQQFSDYIIFQCTQVYADLYDNMSLPVARLGNTKGDSSYAIQLEEEAEVDTTQKPSLARLPQQALSDNVPAQLSLALSRSAEVGFNELCRQLALRSAGDRNSFDVMRLAYSLLTYILATNSLAGTAGRELVRGQGPSPGTRVRPVNQRLVRAGLQAFFQEQTNDGLWAKGQPIYRAFRRKGRNVGNAFIFAMDTLASLLEKIPAQEFRPHLDELFRVLNWVEFHEIVEILPDYCDPVSGQCYGRSLRGWTSPHLSDDSGPQAWSTAQTVLCVSRMKAVVDTLLHQDVLKEFRGQRFSDEGRSTIAWDRLLDSDLGTCGMDWECTLKQVLEERMLLPRVAKETSLASTISLAYSAILFGPPGTAKTTICEALAQYLGWDFVDIDTSVFLADGLTNVASRIRYVFERLLSLRRCVILFDEIEEFCLNRETPGIGMESRMLTTAMLTAINDLRRAKKSIFFLATNRLRAFDAAITRPGRFDMQLFVGTPNIDARIVQLRQKLADVTVEGTKKQEAIVRYREFLAKVWDEDARFFNYLEGMQFASACASLLAQGIELTDERLLTLLKSQATVMTVRGSVREEFLASMELSRL